MMMHRTACLLLLTLLLGMHSARAQDDDAVAMEGRLPDTLVVTASRYAEDARQTGRRVTVLTTQDIRALPVSSYDELLRTVTGMEVQSRGGFGVQSDLKMRGAGFNGALVLLDGVPLNDPQTGHYITDFPVPIASIARIEVLRGPATALYGPGAVGGVIQIFTFAGLRRADTPPAKMEGTATAQYGEHTFYDASGTLRHTLKGTTLSSATTWQGTDGERVGGVTYTDGTPVRTDFEHQAHTAALVQPLGETATLYARAGMDRRTYGAYHFYTAFESDRARSRNATYWSQMRVAERQGATQWQINLAAKQHEGRYVYNFDPTEGFEGVREPADTSRLGQMLAQVSHRFSPSFWLVGGASAEARGVESMSMGDHDDAAAGVFLSGRWQPATRLTMNASSRLDYDPSYGWEPTPQVRIAYTLPRLTFRASAGRAVRAPTYTERYLDTKSPRIDGNLGNPALEPERAWSTEVGADWHPALGLTLHATAFARHARNLIDYAKLNAEDPYYLARNVHAVQTRGVELEAEAHRSVGGGHLHMQAAYTFMDADLGTSEDAADFKYALTAARHLAQSFVTFRTGPLTLGVQGLWKERMATTLDAQEKTYGVANVRGSYRLPAGIGLPLALTGEVRNVFDAQYYDVLDAPMPGRWWIVGLRLGR